MNNIKNRYGQASETKILSLCRTLNETENVPALINDIAKIVPVKILKISSNSGSERKVKDLKGVYKKENINEAVKSRKSNNRYSKEEIASNKKLYERSLKFVQEYCAKHLGSTTRHERFCLEFFLAGLSSQLNKNKDSIRHYWNAIVIINQAMGDKEDWTEKVSARQMLSKFEKHKILSESPLENAETKVSITYEEALLSRSYLSSKKYEAKKIREFYEGLCSTAFSGRIMKANALNALEHERFSILLTDSSGSSLGGFSNERNTVRVFLDFWSCPNRDSLAVQSTLLHELTHKTMDDVFHNASAPYSEGDLQSQNAYRESMRQVLLNLIDAVLPIDELAMLNCNTSYKWIQKNSVLDDDRRLHFVKTEEQFSFVHPWSRNLTLDQLVENCFSEKGILSNPDNVSHLTKRDCVILNGQTICKRDSIGKPNADYVRFLAVKLDDVFGGSYDVSLIDAEFITNTTDEILNRKAEDLAIVQPVLDYINKYVNPAIDEYIANHPSRHHINNGISEKLRDKLSLQRITLFLLCLAFVYSYYA